MSSRTISGKSALRVIDSTIVSLRRKVGEAISAAEGMDAREAEIRDAQVTSYSALAAIRLDLIRGENRIGELDRAHSAADALLEQHAEYVARTSNELQSVSANIKALEDARAELSKEHDAAVAAYEAKVAEIHAALAKRKTYQTLVKAAEDQSAIAGRAHQKLAIANDDLEQKGEAYRQDPLFQYLWKRDFRKSNYKASPFIRFMDGWVARVCKYDQAYRNYDRLTDLPKWLEAHAATQDEKADAALEALEAAEIEALEKGGANELQAKADVLLEKVELKDSNIRDAETSYRQLSEKHIRLRNEQEGPAREARRLLEDGLKQASFPDLRSLAAETLALDDDEIVDRLVDLRREQMSLELEASRIDQRPRELREDLTAMEALRRQFKSARLDSPYAKFKSATIDDILTALSIGQLDARDAFSRLRRAVRREAPRTQPGFGGRGRAKTIGLPDVLGEVIWEVAKGASRSGGKGPSIGFPLGGGRAKRRRSPGISFPKKRSSGGRKGGGFKTGGGF